MPTAPTVIRAAHVWVSRERCHSPGEVCIASDGRVLAVGPTRRRRVEPWLVVPGLVNAHVHLQLPALVGAPRAFVPWLQAVIEARRAQERAGTTAARAQRSLHELLRSGCTAVGEVDSLGTSPPLLRRLDVAGRCYQEVLGFDVGAAAARALVAARFRDGSVSCPAGLSPHAPYSCSSALLRAARRACSHLTVHVAEDRAEISLLREGGGPLRRLLERLGRWPAGRMPPRCSPVEWLQRNGALGPRTLLVHLQEATSADLDLVRAHGAPIVVCPATIAFFGRRPPDVTRWLRAGLIVALGTDSAASSRRGLSMAATMADARRMWPDLTPDDVLAMATRLGAVALGRPSLGRIAAGARADLCAFALPRGLSSREAVDAATSGRARVCATWLRGRLVHADSPA